MRSLPPLLALGLVALASACGGSDAPATDTSSGSSSGTSGSTPDAGGPSPDSGPTPDSGPGPTTGDCATMTGAPGDKTIEITSPAGGGTKRSFDLHVPAKYDHTKKTPLVFMFHGYTMTAASIASTTSFAKTADAHGFIVAFPSGTSGGFNAGDCCGGSVSAKVDDLGFTKDMIAKISADYCVDPKRVHSTGFSNGGFMAYRFACEMSDTFASVASVSGTIGIPPDTCKPKRPVAMLHIHGTSDIVVPYNGGGAGNNRSVAVSVQALRDVDGCAPGDGTGVYSKNDVTCTKWTCKSGSDVEHCAVQGGGHQWPGGTQLPYGGSPSPNLDASEAIATWFDQHPMP